MPELSADDIALLRLAGDSDADSDADLNLDSSADSNVDSNIGSDVEMANTAVNKREGGKQIASNQDTEASDRNKSNVTTETEDAEMDIDKDIHGCGDDGDGGDGGDGGDEMDTNEDIPAPATSVQSNKKKRRRKPRGKGLELQQALNRGRMSLQQQITKHQELKKRLAMEGETSKAAAKVKEDDSLFLERELYRFKCRIDELVATVKSLEDSIAEVQQQSQKKDEEKSEIKRDLEGKIRQSLTREEYLESSATASEKENAVLTHRITQQDSRIEQLNTEVARAKTDRKALNDHIGDCLKSYEQARERISQQSKVIAKFQQHNAELTAQIIARDLARKQEKEEIIKAYDEAKQTITGLEAETVDLRATHEVELKEANELIKKLEGEKKHFKRYQTQKRDKSEVTKGEQAALEPNMNSTDEDTNSETSHGLAKTARPLHQELNETGNESESQEEKKAPQVAKPATLSSRLYTLNTPDPFRFADLSDDDVDSPKSETGTAGEDIIAELLRTPRPKHFNKVRSASVASDFSGEASSQKQMRSSYFRNVIPRRHSPPVPSNLHDFLSVSDARQKFALEIPEGFNDELIETPERRLAFWNEWNKHHASEATQSPSKYRVTRWKTEKDSRKPSWSAMGSSSNYADQATNTDAEASKSETPIIKSTSQLNQKVSSAPATEMPATEDTGDVIQTESLTPSAEAPVTKAKAKAVQQQSLLASSNVLGAEFTDQTQQTNTSTKSSEVPFVKFMDQARQLETQPSLETSTTSSEVPFVKFMDQARQLETRPSLETSFTNYNTPVKANESTEQLPLVKAEDQTVPGGARKINPVGKKRSARRKAKKYIATEDTITQGEPSAIASLTKKASTSIPTHPAVETVSSAAQVDASVDRATNPVVEYISSATQVDASMIDPALTPVVEYISSATQVDASMIDPAIHPVVEYISSATQVDASMIDPAINPVVEYISSATQVDASMIEPATNPVVETTSSATQVDASMIESLDKYKSIGTQTEPVAAPTTLWTDIKSVFRYIFNHRTLTTLFLLYHIIYVSVILWCVWQAVMAGEERAMWRRGNDTTRRASIMLQAHHRRREWLPWMTAARVDYLSTRRYGYGFGGGFGQYGVEY